VTAGVPGAQRLVGGVGGHKRRPLVGRACVEVRRKGALVGTAIGMRAASAQR
jgi:hypothetical protein